jgi:hypothetical protein
MNMPIRRPEHTLRQAFAEIDRTKRLVKDRDQAREETQKRADAAQALQDAAAIQLKNAEARYSVLARSEELAAPELEALQARKTERERELALVRDQLQIVAAQAETVAQARTALGELFANLRGLRADAVRAMETMRQSIEDIRQLPRLPAAVRNMCNALEATYEDLQGRRAGYEVALMELGVAIETLQVEVPAVGYRKELEVARDRLELSLAETERELETKGPGIDPDELRRAREDLEAARFATEEAPRAVQRANLELRAANDALTQAKNSQQAAQDRLIGIEAEFVADIELSAPNAAGIVTARAQLNQEIPPGFALRWQAGAASVEPETGDEVHIDTSQLPVGQTIVEAQLIEIAPAV